jgi:polysaccharide export outer membrane protein
MKPWALAAVLTLLGSGCLLAQGLPTTDVSSAPRISSSRLATASVRSEYYIAPDDQLYIDFVDVPEFTREFRVSPDGQIVLPMLPGAIEAAGLKPAQLAEIVADKYRTADILSDPQVTVWVKESRMHSIAVTGAVRNPQLYPIFGGTTLLDVISQAGGLADDAGDTATITRGDIAIRILAREKAVSGYDGEHAPVAPTLAVDLNRLMGGGDPSFNPALYPGDRVTVKRAGVIYVVGGVNRPGGFTLRSDREEMTVLKAIALAEDVKPTARPGHAMIIRKDPQNPKAHEQIPIDLKKVLAGSAPDTPMEANDILFVPDSTSKRALRRGAEAAVQIATGIIIWHR